MIKKRIRHLGRLREIVNAFTRHGFGYLMKELGLLDLLSVPKRLFLQGSETIEVLSTGERIRMFLEELGPTFIKIGQIASTRPDIIPLDIIQELVKLQDKVSAFPFAEVKKIIEEELADSLENSFREFQETPIAAASIGQVHYAVLPAGEQVAVKVQRPKLKHLIETDLEILKELARLADSRLEWARRYQVRDIVDELAMSIRRELDFEMEARNTEKIAAKFKNNPKVVIPKVFWDYTSAKVLTMEFIDGITLNEEEKLQKLGYDSKVLGETVVNTILQQILIDGFFHGDPHPGNLLVLPNGAIAFLDFGIVGRLSPEMRDHVASFVIALMRQNTDEVLQAISSMGVVPDDVNYEQLRMDVDLLREKYSDLSFKNMKIGQTITDLFSVAFQYKIKLPTDLTILGKTLLTMEGVVEKLDPDLSIIKIAEPFGKRLIMERYRPKTIIDKVWRRINEYGEMILEWPKTINEISAIMKKGRVKIELTTPELNQFIQRLNIISNRISFSITLLSFSIIMAGVIIGTSLSGQTPILLNKIPVVEIGFVIATGMFLWLLFSIFKSGKF
ncbi:AarF/UbiB family protein [Neobacillus sp. OS1-32]|uniref:ABC1 kinase family protein n=1 Tax=Neobacillus sp. OS1-32 TaxID=3070682 RepID=UPI0027E0D928|nr:AarF/UbiB family protein [Neobacillus sp. OS1-32]WML32029.1 AarF/UbiB family protein [Neobacillus sp. OS1-32]